MASILPQVLPNSLSPRQEDVLSKAWAFLILLDPDANKFHFQVYNDRSRKDKGRSIYGGLHECGTELLALNAGFHAVCVSVNEIKAGSSRTNHNVTRIRAMFADDDKQRSKPRTDWALTPSIAVETSKGRYHYYWLVDDLPTYLYTDIQKGIAARYNCDRATVSKAMVARLAGFNHQKGDTFQTRIVKAEPIRYTGKQIIEAFPAPTEEPESIYYQKTLLKNDRVLLKHGGLYQAEAVAWSWRGRQRILIRYLVKSQDEYNYLDQYIDFTQLSKLKTIAAGVDTRLYNDLRTLCPDTKFDFNHLPLSVLDNYFERRLQVQVVTVKRKRDPHNAGHFLPRPKSSWYSRVECIWEVLA